MSDRETSGRRRGWAVWLGATWLMLAAVACDRSAETAGAPESVEPTRGGTVVLGSITGVDNWNPYISGQTFAHDLLRRIYLPLASMRGDAAEHPPTYEPQLAESWAFSEDGRVLTFRLREARWSDGRPVTAGDVVFTWRAQTSSAFAWHGAESKERITAVEAGVGDSVVFRFDRAYANALADAVSGMIVPEHVFGQVPLAEWRHHDWSTARVGSGPFVLEDVRPGDRIVLVPNPHYFREDLPYVERVVARIVPDAANLLSQVLAGDIDYVEGIEPREADRRRDDPRVTLTPFDHPKYDFIGWNGKRAPLDDRRVRLALTLAIDREALVEDLLFGYGRVSAGPVLSYWWAADRELAPWPADRGRALELLAEAGYGPRESDGSLVRNGRPLELEMLTNAGNPVREAMLVKIQEQLSRIGVAVEVSPLETRLLRQRVGTGEFDAWLGGWVFDGRLDLGQLFGSEGGYNLVAYSSGEVDGWLRELETAPDWRAMKPLFHRIQRRIHDDQPYTFLYEVKRLAVSARRLHGVEIPVPFDPLGQLERYWLAPR